MTPSSGVCSTFWKKTEAGCGFEVQGTFPWACHVLVGQKWKDKWGGGVGYSNRNIIIIRRDGSGTVVPIRIRTDSDSDAGCLSAPIVTLPDAYKRIRSIVNVFTEVIQSYLLRVYSCLCIVLPSVLIVIILRVYPSIQSLPPLWRSVG